MTPELIEFVRDMASDTDDAGPRYFSMLAAQLPQWWMVLRISAAWITSFWGQTLIGSEQPRTSPRFGSRSIAAAFSRFNSLR